MKYPCGGLPFASPCLEPALARHWWVQALKLLVHPCLVRLTQNQPTGQNEAKFLFKINDVTPAAVCSGEWPSDPAPARPTDPWQGPPAH